MVTKFEEDYLKALFYLLVEEANEKVGTNLLAVHLNVSPASASSMLKKLKAKELIDYEKYGSVSLTESGQNVAVALIRKHRLWETFLYSYLNFSWDEVHDVAEQLEHINSPKLINELDAFMGHPTKDPHGDLIPSESLEYSTAKTLSLAEVEEGVVCRLTSVKDISSEFLLYFSSLGLELNMEVLVQKVEGFDKSMILKIKNKEVKVSFKFAKSVFVGIEAK